MSSDPVAGALDFIQQGWKQLQLQRPLAAWSSWQQALRLDPGNRAANEALERMAQSPVLPPAAKVTYRFRSPSSETSRLQWDETLKGRDLSNLETAASAFYQLSQNDPHDAPAWYNLALCLAWQGHQVHAINALAGFVAITATANPDAAADAWTLAEILRQGAGAEELADDLSFHGRLPWPPDLGDPADLVPPDCLRRVALTTDPLADNETALLPFEWLDRPMPDGSPNLEATDLPHVAASFAYRDGYLSYSSPVASRLLALFDPQTSPLGQFAAAHSDTWERQRGILPLNMVDAAVFTFRFPDDLDELEVRRKLTHNAIADYYENHWIHQPRHGLCLDPDDEIPPSPLQAAESPPSTAEPTFVLLEGIIRLREQMGRRPGFESLYASYSFDRLRRRLGLPQLDPNTTEERDYACMSRDELRALDPSSLAPQEKVAARRSAEALLDPSLANRFTAPND